MVKKMVVLLAVFIVAAISFSCTYASSPGSPAVSPTPDVNGFYTATNSGVTFKWKIVATDIVCKVSAATTGWVSVGFNTSVSMTGADVIMGYVTSGTTATISEMYSTGHSAPTPDGTQHLTAMSGTEASGTTEIDFTRPLNTGFGSDMVLSQNMSVSIIVAYGPNGSDNFTTQHSSFGGMNITLY